MHTILVNYVCFLLPFVFNVMHMSSLNVPIFLESRFPRPCVS